MKRPSRQSARTDSETRAVRRFLSSEAGAVVMWVCGSLLLAACIAPWLYRGGIWLAGEAAAKELPGVLEWLGAAAGRSASKFGRYFSRSLMFSALLLLPLLWRRIRSLGDGSGPIAGGLRPVPLRDVCLQVLTGCVIAGGLLWLGGMGLAALGAYVPRDPQPELSKILRRTLVPACIVPLVEEWLFRGVLLGLWLRFARPAAACAGSAAVFAFLHFLEPPAGTVIADPSSPGAGFELLGTILRHFADPVFFVTEFATLFFIGWILARARLRTAALWFPIGLHAGWIAAFKSHQMIYRQVESHPLFPWGVGESLRSGAVPLAVLAVTAVCCHFALRWFERRGASGEI